MSFACPGLVSEGDGSGGDAAGTEGGGSIYGGGSGAEGGGSIYGGASEPAASMYDTGAQEAGSIYGASEDAAAEGADGDWWRRDFLAYLTEPISTDRIP